MASAKMGGGVLTSELAQLCLPGAYRDGNQTLAWVNSLCLVYLTVGLVGLKPPGLLIKAVPPIDEPVIAMIEPVPPPTTPPEQNPEEQVAEQNNEPTDAPALVAVTIETPAVVFSVPTVGNLLVSHGVAQAPPLNPMQAVQVVTNKIFDLRLTGRTGDRPAPDYPIWAMQQGMKGEMVILINVDAAGLVTNVEVEKGTGYPRLDNHTVSHVRRRFTFSSADSPRTYRLPVAYDLQ